MSSLRVQITTSCPWKAATRSAWEDSSARLIATPGGKVAVEVGRERAEMLKVPWERRAAVMGAPIVPLAYYVVSAFPCLNN